MRRLQKDLDRQKDENEETREELQNITRSYLMEKTKVEGLLEKISHMSQGKGDQDRRI